MFREATFIGIALIGILACFQFYLAAIAGTPLLPYAVIYAACLTISVFNSEAPYKRVTPDTVSVGLVLMGIVGVLLALIYQTAATDLMEPISTALSGLMLSDTHQRLDNTIWVLLALLCCVNGFYVLHDLFQKQKNPNSRKNHV